MGEIALIRKYLKQRAGDDDDLGRFPFVTISRQAGCRSLALAEEICRQIGGKLAPDMAEGWEVFDQKLCEVVAEDPRLSGTMEAVLSEGYKTEVESFIYDLIAGTSRQYKAYKRIFSVVRSLGLLGKVVIVGRGGAHVTSDMPLGVHIRLVGSEKTRVRRLMELMSIDEKTAVAQVHELDRGRQRLVKSFFDRDIDDPLLYDAVFNIDRMDASEIAAMVVDMIEQRLSRFTGERPS